jgi:hypothetical protein
MKALRPLQLGDFYPLARVNTDESLWAAWQFDRPERGRGYAVFFRRPESPYPVFSVRLRGLEPTARYAVVFDDTGRKATMTGEDLARLRVELPDPATCALVTYVRVAG